MSKPDRAIGYDGQPIQQRPDEFAKLIQLVKDQKVTKYLEVGLRHGRTFYAVVEAMPPNSVAVGIDIQDNRFIKTTLDVLKRKVPTTLCRYLNGDSNNIDTAMAAKQYGPFDLVFIDADHSYEAVKRDWDNYGLMGKIIAFHDIDCDAEGYGAGKLWRELKANHRCEEIIGEARGMGIGVLFKKQASGYDRDAVGKSFRAGLPKQVKRLGDIAGLGTDDAGD